MTSLYLSCVSYFDGHSRTPKKGTRVQPRVNIACPDGPISVPEGRTPRHTTPLILTWVDFLWPDAGDLGFYVAGETGDSCLDIPTWGSSSGYASKQLCFPVETNHVSLMVTLFERSGNIIAQAERPFVVDVVLGEVKASVTRVCQNWRSAEVVFSVQQMPEGTKTLKLALKLFGQEMPQGESCVYRGPGQYTFETIPWVMTSETVTANRSLTEVRTVVLMAYDENGRLIGTSQEKVPLNSVKL